MLLFLMACPKITPPTASTQVQLIDAGSTPQEVLRFDIDETSESASMILQTALQMAVGGVMAPADPVQPMQIGLGLQLQKIRRSGQATYLFTCPSLQLIESPEISEGRRQRLLAQLEPVRMLSGQATVENTGLHSDLMITPPKDVPPSLTRFLEEAHQGMVDLSPVFPQEAVGVGARWTYTVPTRIAGLTISQGVTATLISHKDHQVALRTEIHALPLSQDSPIQGLPATASVEELKVRVRGSGLSMVDLQHVFPTEAQAQLSGDISMRISDPTLSTEVLPMLIAIDALSELRRE